ncbi:3-methyl-2-oxobutanoate hydroxymethyltransferase [Alkalibacter saccharofermentans]|uniref:3-methyl-2-oxobutanoate hydroxymethyltransferase n=1 Tax=Alkalibacter saccharofermentans DSM 14828 TaxID=1120975 RepID=A0A1M4Y179_9FIRM|nr:3-methyl-2-oxobutanoate hydroxymethyltransferase [Alkalibacter saccharofermentans]SHE99501.1 3-methyl-2-oxobutanoate hydroxymethyltransferase [Alkalibacter saccharofermentans DSM 14828]
MKSKFSVDFFARRKDENKKISMLTAYDYSTAKIFDEAGVDALLVGDSLGMVMQGLDSTLEVTMEDMIYHCSCVSRGADRAFVVGDMPFLSYHISVEESVRNAGRLIQHGKANAVKLEGGINVSDKIKAIVDAQIPVMGHIGLTPQSVNVFGGFKVQGKDYSRAKAVLEDAIAVEEAGAFAVVLEGIPEKLAKLISETISIPTIGIGAGRYCDGQVLVMHDLLGLFSGQSPKFSKKYADLRSVMENAVKGYIEEVTSGDFPESKHTFSMEDKIIDELKEKQ